MHGIIYKKHSRLPWMTGGALLLGAWAMAMQAAPMATEATTGAPPAQASVRTEQGSALQFLGQAGGVVARIEVAGNRAFMGVGPRLLVVDITANVRPRVVYTSTLFSDLVRGIDYYDDRLYVARGDDGLLVFERDGLYGLSAKSSFPFIKGANDVASGPGHAYVVSEDGLHILDTSNDSEIREIGWLKSIAGGRIVPGPSRISVANGHAFIVAGDFLYVVDISPSTAPLVVGASRAYGFRSVVAIVDKSIVYSDGYHYDLEDGSSSVLDVLNMDNPSNPILIRGIGLSGLVRDIASKNDVIALALDNPLLPLFDARVSTDPLLTSEIPVKGGTRAVALTDDRRLLISPSDGGLDLYNIGTLARPISLHSMSLVGSARDVRMFGDWVFIAAGNRGLQVVNANVPEQPMLISSVSTSASVDYLDYWSHNVYASGAGTREVYIFDVLSQQEPTLMHTLLSRGNVTDVTASAGLLYVTSDAGAGTLEIFDVHDPANPQKLGSIAIRDARRVDVSGDYAVVISRTSVTILDVRDPLLPTAVGMVALPGIRCARLLNNVLYIGHRGTSGEFDSLAIYNIDTPQAPAQISDVVAEGLIPIMDIDIIGSNAFLLGTNQLYAFDVSDPTIPVANGAYGSLLQGNRVFGAGSRVVVADRFGGIYIFAATNPTSTPTPNNSPTRYKVIVPIAVDLASLIMR